MQLPESNYGIFGEVALHLIVKLMPEIPELMQVAGGTAVAGADRAREGAVGTRLVLPLIAPPPTAADQFVDVNLVILSLVLTNHTPTVYWFLTGHPYRSCSC